MIVDVHSHYQRYPAHFTAAFREETMKARKGVEVDLTVRWDEYAATATGADHSIVFGGKARLSGIWIDDDEVAAYAAERPDRLTRFPVRGPDAAGMA